MILYCDRIYMEDGMKKGFLEIEDGKFKAFYDDKSQIKADQDWTGYRIIPGIIDTHNHGCMGYNLMDVKKVAESFEIEGYLKGLASLGVTGAFPTTTNVMTIAKLAEMSDQPLVGTRILGIHSEGPWGARVGEKGVNTGYPAVDMDVARKMVEAGKGKLRLVDIAPEVPGALEAIQYFVQNGVTVGAYHTNANYEEANRGIDAGITVATHLGNVMTGLHHRDIGTLGACLLRPEVDCEVICDGMHVSLEMIRIYFKVKDYSRFMMVSDNVQYAGLPEGKYRGMSDDPTSDRKTITINEEGFVLSETGRLSGSSKPVIYGIKNLVEKLSIPMETVLTMSSLNPAKKYGFAKRKGSIRIGKDADFVVIDDEYHVMETVCEGQKIFDHSDKVNLVNEAYLQAYKIG